MRILKIALLFILPFCFVEMVSAQRLSKEERKEKEQKAYDIAVTAIKSRSFVIVPSSYTDKDGIIMSTSNPDNFFSAEITKFFAQGWIVCGNSNTNILEVTDYDARYNKKGNLRLRVVVKGRMMAGTYMISMRARNNEADVIYTEPGEDGVTLRFSGPILPLKGADYNKRSNAM